MNSKEKCALWPPSAADEEEYWCKTTQDNQRDRRSGATAKEVCHRVPEHALTCQTTIAAGETDPASEPKPCRRKHKRCHEGTCHFPSVALARELWTKEQKSGHCTTKRYRLDVDRDDMAQDAALCALERARIGVSEHRVRNGYLPVARRRRCIDILRDRKRCADAIQSHADREGIRSVQDGADIRDDRDNRLQRPDLVLLGRELGERFCAEVERLIRAGALFLSDVDMFLEVIFGIEIEVEHQPDDSTVPRKKGLDRRKARQLLHRIVERLLRHGVTIDTLPPSERLVVIGAFYERLGEWRTCYGPFAA